MFLRTIVFAALSLHAAANGNFVVLNWQPSATAVSNYRVYKSSGKCASFARQKIVDGTVWIDAAVISGKTYCYFVTSFNESTQLESGPSNEIQITIP
jgi:fibronectin type 3 domain-containing protein